MEKALGIFDSGIGGLTVLKEINKVLPKETTIYLGDTARVPYGTKSAATIKRYAFEDARFLIEQGIKLLVVACNTASANATTFLRERLDLPIVEVIQPGARKAAETTSPPKSPALPQRRNKRRLWSQSGKKRTRCQAAPCYPPRTPRSKTER